MVGHNWPCQCRRQARLDPTIGCRMNSARARKHGGFHCFGLDDVRSWLDSRDRDAFAGEQTDVARESGPWCEPMTQPEPRRLLSKLNLRSRKASLNGPRWHNNSDGFGGRIDRGTAAVV
jgi:hypothetical protein